MSTALAEDLTLVPIDADDRLPSRCWAEARLGEARDVFGTASRLLRPAEGERPAVRGPGWFDSSWELRRGCEVCEGWPGDGSLRDWIEGWLYGAAGGGASLSAT